MQRLIVTVPKTLPVAPCFGFGLAVPLATPARAECLGSCLDGMVTALGSIVVYGLIGIVLLVMLVRAKWRRAGFWSLAVVFALAIGVPLISQAVQLGKVRAMERHEIVGAPPPITERTPLVIGADGACQYSACAAVLWGQSGKEVYVLPLESFAGLDMTKPLELDDLPLELWAVEEGSDSLAQRRLAPDERARAAARIDYLVIVGWGYSRVTPNEIGAALRRNPALAGAGDDAQVELLLAPLNPLRPELSLAEVQPDLLDLSLMDWALALPLAPMNETPADNSAAGAEVAARAFCPTPDGAIDLYCLNLLDR
jgi:hypothetical protein